MHRDSNFNELFSKRINQYNLYSSNQLIMEICKKEIVIQNLEERKSKIIKFIQ